MSEKVLIIGATSAIATEAAKCFAAEKASLFLVARSRTKLQELDAEFRGLGAKDVHIGVLDANRPEQYAPVIAAAWEQYNGLDLCLIAHATPFSPQKYEQDISGLPPEIQTNFTSTLSLLLLLAKRLEAQKSGTLAVITSVAGERGRRQQYLYGACKAAMSVVLQGLRQRLTAAGIAVVDIRPGLTATPLTAHLPKSGLFASAVTVGRGVYRAMKAKRYVAYVPWYWKYIMFFIRLIPEFIFKRMNF